MSLSDSAELPKIFSLNACEHEEQRRIELGGVIFEQVHDLPEAVAGDEPTLTRPQVVNLPAGNLQSTRAISAQPDVVLPVVGPRGLGPPTLPPNPFSRTPCGRDHPRALGSLSP